MALGTSGVEPVYIVCLGWTPKFRIAKFGFKKLLTSFCGIK